MPKRRITLSPEHDAFIARLVASGEYRNASEVVSDALRALGQRRRADALKLKALRSHVAAGVDDLDRGAFVRTSAYR